MGIFSGVFDYVRYLGKNVTKGADYSTMRPPTPIPINSTSDNLVNTNILTPEQKKWIESYTKNKGKNGKNALNSLIKEFYFTLKDKDSLSKAIEKVRGNSIVTTIVDVMIDDGLMASNDPVLFTFNYKGDEDQNKQQIEDLLNDLIQETKLHQVILDFMEDCILQGEYMLPIEITRNKGITKIKDNPETEKMVCIYEGQNKKYFLKRKNNSVEKLEKDSHIHFLLSYKKVRIKVQSFLLNQEDEFMDEHIKTGKSLILPILNQLNQLEVLQMANLAEDLKKMLSPVLVMVGMPEDTDSTEIGKIVEEYEKILQNMFSNIDLDNVQFQDFLRLAGEIRVLPSVGNTKGSIQTLNPRGDRSSDRSRTEEIRKECALILGMPFYYFSLLGENTMSRIESLKLISRWSRKLNSMQFCLKTGIKELFCLHLKEFGFNISPDDLELSMRQIVNVELLDTVDIIVSLTEAFKDILSVLNSVTENKELGLKINRDNLLKLFDKLLLNFPECGSLLEIENKNENEKETKLLLENIVDKIMIEIGKKNNGKNNTSF